MYESVLLNRIRIILLKADPDPHQSEKPDTKQDPDPDLHQSQNSGAVEAHSEKSDLDPHQSEKRDPDSHQRDAYPLLCDEYRYLHYVSFMRFFYVNELKVVAYNDTRKYGTEKIKTTVMIKKLILIKINCYRRYTTVQEQWESLVDRTDDQPSRTA